MGDAVEQPRQPLGELDRRILHRVAEAAVRGVRTVGVAGIAPDEVPRLIAGVAIFDGACQQQGQLIALMGVLGDAATGFYVQQAGAGPQLVQRQTVLTNGANVTPLAQNGVFFVAVGVAALGLFATPVAASTNATMSQVILPVYFVYLEKDGKIDRVWNNVTEKDSAYAVKFFDKKTTQEIENNQELLALFMKKNQEFASQKTDADVRFLQSKNGLEEVRTYS